MLIETEETNQFTFEPFAAHAFYTEVNRSLVHQALAPDKLRSTNEPLTIVDMACGTGAVTRLIAEEMRCQGRQARIIGVDPSAEALRLAQKGMAEIGAKAEFFQGDTEDLPRLVHDADAAFFCEDPIPKPIHAGTDACDRPDTGDNRTSSIHAATLSAVAST